jgi:hypothetical protein
VFYFFEIFFLIITIINLQKERDSDDFWKLFHQFHNKIKLIIKKYIYRSRDF